MELPEITCKQKKSQSLARGGKKGMVWHNGIILAIKNRYTYTEGEKKKSYFKRLAVMTMINNSL